MKVQNNKIVCVWRGGGGGGGGEEGGTEKENKDGKGKDNSLFHLILFSLTSRSGFVTKLSR